MEHIVNFRDLGGLKTTDNKVIQSKRLLRSGELTQLTVYDKMELINTYKLNYIIDFRSEKEIKTSPDDVIEGTVYLPISVMSDLEGHVPSMKNLMESASHEEVDKIMMTLYRRIITSRTAQNGFRCFFDIIDKSKEGAVIFHCFAGKDRTGIAAALLLKLLGVEDTIIFEDFLKTNEARLEANKEIIAKAIENGFPSTHKAALEAVLNVKASYLQAAFDTINEQYGSFEIYLKDTLNIDELMQQRIKTNYL